MNLIMVTEGNKCTMSDAKSSDEVLTFNVTDKYFFVFILKRATQWIALALRRSTLLLGSL